MRFRLAAWGVHASRSVHGRPRARAALVLRGGRQAASEGSGIHGPPAPLAMSHDRRSASLAAILLTAFLVGAGAPAAAQEPAPSISQEAVPAALQATAPDPRLELDTRPAISLRRNGADEPSASMSRNHTMINGGLIALGALGIFDNVVVHWILGWHRAIEDHPHNLEIEIGIVAASAAMLTAGIWRERRARAEARAERSGCD